MRGSAGGRFGLVAAVGLGLAACAPVGAGGTLSGAANAPLREDGRQLAGLMCARCHAIGPDGLSPNSLALPFRYLGQKYAPQELAAAISEQVITRHPVMPTYRLTPAQRDALNAYIASIQSAAKT